LHGMKIVIIFKWDPNVQPAAKQPALSFLKIQGDPARAIISETYTLVK
jgi:hypothetical protein